MNKRNHVRRKPGLQLHRQSKWIVGRNLRISFADPPAARGKSAAVRAQPAVQNHLRRDVRHFRQIRGHPTDTRVS